MAISYHTSAVGLGVIVLCLSTDTKPVNAPVSYILFETDTGNTFVGGGTVWNAVSGEGSDPWTYIKTITDFTNATTTFTTITGLTFTPPVNSDWTLEAQLLLWTTTIANLPRVGVNIAAGATRGMGGINIWQAGATATTSVHANGAWNNVAGVTNVQITAGGVLTASVPYLCEITATGRSGAAPTAISLQMACEMAGANICFIKRGSFLRHRTV